MRLPARRNPRLRRWIQLVHSTNVLALEAALRRKDLEARAGVPTRLAAHYRLLRRQRFEGPGLNQHFHIWNRASRGRTRGGVAFETGELGRQLRECLAALRCFLLELVTAGGRPPPERAGRRPARRPPARLRPRRKKPGAPGPRRGPHRAAPSPGPPPATTAAAASRCRRQRTTLTFFFLMLTRRLTRFPGMFP